MTAQQIPVGDGPSHRLRGRVAIVTGASRGIGLAIAQRLAAEGAHVALTARQPEPLAEAVNLVAAGGTELSVCGFAGKADDPGHQDEVIAGVLARFGRLDILVLNAGINPAYGPLLGLDLAAARKIIDVNVLAPLSWAQRAVAADPSGFATRGSVVTITSVTGDTPSPGIGMYGVSKAALIALTRELGFQLGPDIRVNAVAPAVVKTQFAQALYAADEERAARPYPLKRLGVPEDIAGAVSFLLSAEAGWITGQTLVLDGGVTLSSGL